MIAVGRSRAFVAVSVATLGWSAFMAASAALSLSLSGWQTQAHIARVALLFGLGGLFAFPPAILLAGWLGGRWTGTRRFALAMVALAVATISVTAMLYALQYRLYYSEWHDNVFTVRWMFEVGFTTLAALYQFAVLGMRHFLPLGLVGLAVVSIGFARR